MEGGDRAHEGHGSVLGVDRRARVCVCRYRSLRRCYHGAPSLCAAPLVACVAGRRVHGMLCRRRHLQRIFKMVTNHHGIGDGIRQRTCVQRDHFKRGVWSRGSSQRKYQTPPPGLAIP